MRHIIVIVLLCLYAVNAGSSSFRERIQNNFDSFCETVKANITQDHEPLVERIFNESKQSHISIPFKYDLYYCGGNTQVSPLYKMVQDFSDSMHLLYVYCNASDVTMIHVNGPQSPKIPVIELHFYLQSMDPTLFVPSQCPIRPGESIKVPVLSYIDRIRMNREAAPNPPPQASKDWS